MPKQANIPLATLQQMNDEPTQTALATLPAEEPTPMALIADALDRGADPDKLKSLVDLQERYEANQARKAFARAMSDCQAEMPTVVKDTRGDKSDYAKLETLQKEIKPIYLKHGFTVSFGEADSSKADCLRVQCRLRHRDGHEEFYFRDAPPDVNGPKGNPVKTVLQGSQSSVSYLRRNILTEIFGVTIAGQDKDGAIDGDPITRVQQEEIYRLATEAKMDPAAILKFAKIEQLSDMRQGPNHKKVYYMLKDRINDLKAANGGGQ